METPRERELKQRAKQEYIESMPLREDYQAVFGTAAGVRVLLDFIRRGGVFATRFTNNGWTAFNEGECNFVLRICDYAPHAFKEATAMFFDDVADEQARTAAEILDSKSEE